MNANLRGGLFPARGKPRTLRLSKSTPELFSEHDHQAAFFAFLRLNERDHPVLARFFAIPNGGFRYHSTAVKLKQEGLRPGVLDTFLPVSRNGKHGLWLEFKSARNQLTPEQRSWKEFLEGEGYEAHVVRSWTDAVKITIDYLSIEGCRGL